LCYDGFMDTSPWLKRIVTKDDFPRRICGRLFSREDLELIRKIIKEDPRATNRSQISRLVCQALSWFKPDGGLKEMSCRVVLLRLHRGGLIELPPARHPDTNARRRPKRTPEGEPQEPISKPVAELLPIELVRVTSKKGSPLWNELIDRYHYLGYSPLPGAQIRYLVYSSAGCVAALGFSAAAWKVKPRDLWIGWSPSQREQNLHLVVNNSRFLILPWVQSKNLASKILSLSAKRLPQDWQEVYGFRPVLLETFVERERFVGTCYKAANWQFVGSTQGRGKLDTFNEHKLPVKDIYLYPLERNLHSILTGGEVNP